MNDTRRQQSGFTLLELIVALAVSALLAVAGAGALSSMIDFYQRNLHRGLGREDVRAAERTIRHEWAGRGLTVQSDGAVLEFDTAHPVTLSLPEILAVAHVRYSCENQPEAGLVLRHQIRFLPTQPVKQPPNGVGALQEDRILATGLRSCAFSFLAQQTTSDGRLVPNWVGQWKSSAEAPLLMRMVLSTVRTDMPAVVYKARLGISPQ